MRIRSVALLWCAALLLASCQRTAKAKSSAPIPAVSAAQPDDGTWLAPAKDYAGTRFSGLDQINTGNVANLRLAWSFSTGVRKGHEAGPLIVGDTMYYVTPFPNTLYALDLRQKGTVKWRYDPKPVRAAQGVACCDVVNRGAVWSDGTIFLNALDGHTAAVDAESGQEVWKTKVADINRGESLTMAPLVVKGKVLVGNSGGEFGVRGFLAALDARSGKVAWKAYSTGPDSEVLIGARFRPYYAKDRGRDLGVSSWQKDQWKIGGGSVWGWITYDPELNLVFYGTGNPGPWNPDMRPGDNRWTCSVFARDADTGEAVWAYQWSPHDLYDYDGINELVLAELPVGGENRKVLLCPERDGYLYVIDRRTGQVLSADPFTHVTTSEGFDYQTGKMIPNEALATGFGKRPKDICPASPGGKDWQPTAWSPRTKLLYIPHNNLCMEYEAGEVSYIAGTPYVGATVRMYPGPGGNRGEFSAWDPVARRKVWSIKEKYPAWSGALVTAGDVVFYGTMDRQFKAVDARSGNILWQHTTASGIIGQPVSFRGPDGRQYIAIADGVGGWAGAVVAGGLDPADETAALGFVGVMKDLPQATNRGGTIYVFSLP